MWLLLIVIGCAALVLHIVIPRKYHWPSTLKALNKIPGPTGLPYFDNSFTFIISNDEFMPTLTRLMDQYKPICRIRILGTAFVFLTELDDIEIILNSRRHIKKGVDYDFLLPWLGTGLLISNGKKWFDHRKWLTPAFHFSILEQYIDIMNKNANILCNLLESHGGDSHIEINSYISNCALDIICETAMGTHVNAQLGGEKIYVKSILRMSQIFQERSLKPWLYRDIMFKISSLGREHKKVLKIVHQFTRKVIKERQLAYKEKHVLGENKESEESDIGGKKKMSFLDLLIEFSETQNRLTEEEIREEVDTFMFEGYDTTAASVIWALFQLGLNPDIQEKVYREQCEIFHDLNEPINSAHLQEMKYLERVIKETLRLYPSVPIISRQLEEDVKIRDYILPAETQTPIFIYYIHRDPKIYPDPEKFDPDRFLPDALRGRHPYSYIPFSAGPRNCIGQRFAMMEEKVTLSHIIRKFKVTSLDKLEDVKVMGEIILRPKNDLKMIFTKR